MATIDARRDDYGQVLYRVLARSLYLAFGLVLLLLFIRTVRWLALLSLFTIILFMALNPVVTWLERHRVKRAWGTLVCLLGILLLTVGLVLVMLPPVVAQGQNLVQNLPGYEASVRGWVEGALQGSPELRGIVGGVVDVQGNLQRLSGVAAQIGHYTLGAVEAVATVLVLVALVGFLLADPRPLIRSFLLTFPEERRTAAQCALARSSDMIAGWVRSNLIIGAIEAVATGTFLALMHVPGALLWAVLAFFAELIPTVGPLLMALPPLLFALTVSPATAFWVLVFYVVSQRVLSDLVAPRVRATSMALHPVSLIIGVLALTAAFGPVGAFVAAPAVAILKACYEELGPLRTADAGAIEAQVDEVLAPRSAPPTAPCRAPRRTRAPATPSAG